MVLVHTWIYIVTMETCPVYLNNHKLRKMRDSYWRFNFAAECHIYSNVICEYKKVGKLKQFTNQIKDCFHHRITEIENDIL